MLFKKMFVDHLNSSFIKYLFKRVSHFCMGLSLFRWFLGVFVHAVHLLFVVVSTADSVYSEVHLSTPFRER